ncbi:MAG: hypothetical protein JXM71_02140 [Spirochaetales bacterium]|nr:hypothetical protein [Spirochaetales bacterium]
MNPLLITALIFLALASTGWYFYGTKKNKFIASSMSRDLEAILKPRTTNYVNIGGVIGYNFTYALPAPFTSAKGTMTMSPRHSLLYLPVSLLMGVRDRFFVNIFTKKKLRAEAHLVESSYLGKARIEGSENMDSRQVVNKGKSYTLLWKGEDLSFDLEKLLESLPEPGFLRHFCVYPGNKTFFIHLRPQGGNIKGDVEAIYERLQVFYQKEKE